MGAQSWGCFLPITSCGEKRGSRAQLGASRTRGAAREIPMVSIPMVSPPPPPPTSPLLSLCTQTFWDPPSPHNWHSHLPIPPGPCKQNPTVPRYPSVPPPPGASGTGAARALPARSPLDPAPLGSARSPALTACSRSSSSGTNPAMVRRGRLASPGLPSLCRPPPRQHQKRAASPSSSSSPPPEHHGEQPSQHPPLSVHKARTPPQHPPPPHETLSAAFGLSPAVPSTLQ